MPDPICHSLGMRGNVHFGRAPGRTEDSEVTTMLRCDGGVGIEGDGTPSACAPWTLLLLDEDNAYNMSGLMRAEEGKATITIDRGTPSRQCRRRRPTPRVLPWRGVYLLTQ